MAHYRNETIINGIALKAAADNDGISTETLFKRIAKEGDTYWNDYLGHLVGLRVMGGERWTYTIGHADIADALRVTGKVTGGVDTQSKIYGTQPDVVMQPERSEEDRRAAAVIDIATEIAKVTADEISRLIRDKLQEIGSAATWKIKELSEEEVERIRAEIPGSLTYPHTKVSSVIKLTEPDLLAQAEQGVIAGEFRGEFNIITGDDLLLIKEAIARNGHYTIPGSWTRVDTPAFKAAMQSERNEAWTEGVKSAIDHLKNNGMHASAYQLANETINNPRWKS